MSGGRRRKGGGHGGEFHVDERWMASYMDMVTVLMCLFIVLYAMSTIDQTKFKSLANSLATGFGTTKTTLVDSSKGVIVTKDLLAKKGEGFSAQTGGATTLKEKIEKALKKANIQGATTVTIDSRGVTIGLVGSAAYFAPNAAELQPQALHVLRALAPVVSSGSEQVTVEGYAAPDGSPGIYGTDWNLASARALAVLGWLNSDGGVAGDRLSSVSYGSAHALTGESALTAEKNRRVDIVLHTGDNANAAGASTTTAQASASASATPTASASASAGAKH